MTSAFVSEIYESVQGEGPFTGERQIFVRLAGCPLRCRYCDTPDSLTAKGHPRKSVDDVMATVMQLSRSTKTKTVSLTGGEPLAQGAFILALARALKKKGFRTYLETAGVHPTALAPAAPFLDTIAMDIKLPSSTGRSFWADHAAFLKTGGKKIFVKVVIEKKTNFSDFKRAVNVVARRASPPLFVIQPATPIAGQVGGPPATAVASAYSYASKRLPRVLVMPQQHKIWGAR